MQWIVTIKRNYNAKLTIQQCTITKEHCMGKKEVKKHSTSWLIFNLFTNSRNILSSSWSWKSAFYHDSFYIFDLDQWVETSKHNFTHEPVTPTSVYDGENILHIIYEHPSHESLNLVPSVDFNSSFEEIFLIFVIMAFVSSLCCNKSLVQRIISLSHLSSMF